MSETDSETNQSKLDAYLWPENPISKYQRSRQHLEGMRVSTNVLFAYRILACTLMWVIYADSTYIAFWNGSHFWHLQYFTEWGIWMTTALFTVLVIGHILNSEKTGSSSMWCMWKWCTALH